MIVAALRIVVLLLLASGLSGCFVSKQPLITKDQATFPYSRIGYGETDSTDVSTLVHEGDAYVLRNAGESERAIALIDEAIAQCDRADVAVYELLLRNKASYLANVGQIGSIELLREAHRESALGVRWALYDNDEVSRAILKKARAMGFVAVNRDRVVMVHKKNAEFLQPNVWKMNDSLFSFDP